MYEFIRGREAMGWETSKSFRGELAGMPSRGMWLKPVRKVNPSDLAEQKGAPTMGRSLRVLIILFYLVALSELCNYH
jgi:hypothetical protein